MVTPPSLSLEFQLPFERSFLSTLTNKEGSGLRGMQPDEEDEDKESEDPAKDPEYKERLAEIDPEQMERYERGRPSQ